jgi:nephrocystin-3
MVSDASRKRLLRLFLSSTFRDMQIERDILARLVLPRQRAMLAGERAALQEVDLRWGITAAMASDGGALAVCLRQVAECFPLVLGLLGRRTGGAPPRIVVEKFDPAFAEALPKGASFTEAEMRYAAYLARHEPDVKLLIMVRSDRLSAEIAFDPAEWAAGEAFRSWALTSLAVRAVEYDSFDQFERRVDQELERVLRAEATRKNCSSVVVPGLPELDRSRELAAFSRAAARRRPTLVKSERGIGVSWLARRWVSSDPHGLYVDGRGLAALDLVQTLRSPEGAERGDAPDEPRGRQRSADQCADERTMALMARMSGPPAARRIVFDHYEDGFVSDARADLAWIPTKLPRGCSVVVITRGERRLEAQARDLGWQLHTVERIDPSKAAEFAIQYLEVFGKHLAPDQIDILKSAPWTTNFASLILALDELRRYGAHETLAQRLTELASHANGPALVEELVAGLTSVMPEDWRAAVEDAVLAIRISVRGLQEQEVRAAVGAVAAIPASNISLARGNAQTLPSYLWSAIQISLGQELGHERRLVGRRRDRHCPPCARPSSNSSPDHRHSDARAAENGFAAKSSVNKSAKVVLVALERCRIVG